MAKYVLENTTVEGYSHNPYQLLIGWGEDSVEIDSPGNIASYRCGRFSIATNSCLVQKLTIDRDAHCKSEVIIFLRGYISSWGVDQNSDGQDIYRALKKNIAGGECASGIFVLFVYESDTQTLTMLSDAFGVSPLYERKIGTMSLWSNNSSYLSLPEDEMDLLAFRSFIQSEYIPNNRTLIDGVRRVKSGAGFSIDASGQVKPVSNQIVYPDSLYPEVSDDILDTSASLLHESISDTLPHGNDDIVLPLSGGWDSRRILGDLTGRGLQPSCYSSQVFNDSGIEVDAVIAEEIAGHFKLPFERVARDFYRTENVSSRAVKKLSSMESLQHVWALSLFNLMPASSYIYDGLGGDVFGETGFEKAGYFELKDCRSQLIADILDPAWNFMFKDKAWPSVERVAEEFQDSFTELGADQLLSEKVFLELHTRRSTGLWGQALAPASTIVVCPYLEPAYAQHMLKIAPGHKLATNVQKSILARSFPELCAFAYSAELGRSATKNKACAKKIVREKAVDVMQSLDAMRDNRSPLYNTLLPFKIRTVLATWPGFVKMYPGYAWRIETVVDALLWWTVDRAYLQRRRDV